MMNSRSPSQIKITCLATYFKADETLKYMAGPELLSLIRFASVGVGTTIKEVFVNG